MLSRRALLGLLATCSIVAICPSTLAGKPDKNFNALKAWIEQNGGWVKNIDVGKNSAGVRGLFATEDIPAGENIMKIPSSCMINAGSQDDTIATGTLLVLRELKDKKSRFAPYIKTFPGPKEVVNMCNMPEKYWGLFQNQHWHEYISETQDYLRGVYNGSLNHELNFTMAEMVGRARVSFDDLKYACAVATTRYVNIDERKRLMLVPVFDMMNHRNDCPHYITELGGDDHVMVVTGADVKKGEELCYKYIPTIMRDDYGIVHYGFLPELADPPQVAQCDDARFDSENDSNIIPDEPYMGNQGDMVMELGRVKGTIQGLELAAKLNLGYDGKVPEPGTDKLYDMFMEYRQRRINALKIEMERLDEVRHYAPDVDNELPEGHEGEDLGDDVGFESLPDKEELKARLKKLLEEKGAVVDKEEL